MSTQMNPIRAWAVGPGTLVQPDGCTSLFWDSLSDWKDGIVFLPIQAFNFPPHWPSIFLLYRYGNSEYRITVFQVSANSSSRWKMGDQSGDGDTIRLEDDGQIHIVEIYCAVLKTSKQTAMA